VQTEGRKAAAIAEAKVARGAEKEAKVEIEAE